MAYALITGASSGIGYELAELFARHGHDVVLTARNETKLRRLAARLGDKYGVHAISYAIDLGGTDAAAKLHAFTTQRGLDVRYLVNNAGFAEWSTFLDMPIERVDEMLRVNVTALTELAHRYGRDMRRAGGGRILNVSSVASMMAGPYMATYFASKAYVRSFSEALAYELKGSGVSVTCVCPGPTTTGFAAAAHMAGINFFTLTRPATARQLAEYAYRSMMRGRTLAYHGPTTMAGALAERLLPRAVTRRIAAVMNGGDPSRAHRR
ncbi:SDR family NAD(P)-dependent oxidoreductase [Bifidobacterium simiarum]|uniref:Short-chain dehydrogenase n=1 Tax=Bifidobacterium simiarum TaxID=2045441 RepID=A0A2M9HDV8_9BIFI|nr:SDR family oxidoreductase [Bifidobacterium simiarum]PJM74977.1 short-chain dehydrogenase [Bifidobacterium simiarum]